MTTIKQAEARAARAIAALRREADQADRAANAVRWTKGKPGEKQEAWAKRARARTNQDFEEQDVRAAQTKRRE